MSETQKSHNPYVGPGPFSQDDAFRFFGREREVADLQSLVSAHRSVLLYAQSGAGKSSILNAGLIPRLARKGFDVLEGGRFAQLPPKYAVRNIFVFNACASLPGPDASSVETKRATIREILESLPRRFSQRPGTQPRSLPRVLVFDQFEEMFRYQNEHWKMRGEFFEELNDAMVVDPGLRVVCAMREDFVASLDPYQDLLPEALRTRYRLEKLRAGPALSAIVQPLHGTGISFAEGVPERLVEDLRTSPLEPQRGGNAEEPLPSLGHDARVILDEYVEPVQLQVVCFNLFRKLSPGATTINDADRSAFGDVDRALQEFYEGALVGTSSETLISIPELRRWFESMLITDQGTRGLVFMGPDKTGGLLNDAVRILDETFHIVRPEVRPGGTWYELSHDRFIQPILRANHAWRAEARAAEAKRLEDERNAFALKEKRARFLAWGFAILSLLAVLGVAAAAYLWTVARASNATLKKERLNLEQQEKCLQSEKNVEQNLSEVLTAQTSYNIVSDCVAHRHSTQSANVNVCEAALSHGADASGVRTNELLLASITEQISSAGEALAKSRSLQASSCRLPQTSNQMIGKLGLNESEPRPDPRQFKIVHASELAAYQILDSKPQVPLPFPNSRGGVEPILRLADVWGAEGASVESAVIKAGLIRFQAVGNTGSVSNPVGTSMVANHMIEEFSSSEAGPKPSFLLNLGDIVFGFGESQYYYDEFYAPYQNYPAPILALAGNHDGMVNPISTTATKSLSAFLDNFCRDGFYHGPDGGEKARTTQIQPGVYYTLDSPFVKIIVLYSGTLESPGVISSEDGKYPYLSDAQLAFLRAAFERVNRENYRGAIILAVHHPPYSGIGRVQSPRMLAQIDQISRQTGVWPHAVLSAHAQNYQRFTRNIDSMQIPYLISGGGGHGLNHLPAGMRTPQTPSTLSNGTDRVVFERFADMTYGFVTATVNSSQLQLVYHPAGSQTAPVDSVIVDLHTHKIIR